MSDATPTQPPFVLVDGSYYLFRTYHALPPLKTTQGLHTNAIRGTLNALHKLIRRYQPTHMAVAFDTKSPTFRHELSEDYKAHRPSMDSELSEQIPYIHRLITALGIPLIMVEGAEADDIIGTLAKRACQEGHHVLISTGDKDMAQLVNKKVILEDSFTGRVTDEQGVVERFGVRAEQMIDYLTLMGDSSDGIKGVPGIGKKTAEKLLQTYDNIGNILANAENIKGRAGKNLVEYADTIPLNHQLASIVCDLPLVENWQDMKLTGNNTKALRTLYTELEFKNDLKSLDHPNHPDNIRQENAKQPSQNQASTAVTTTSNWHTVLTQTDFTALVNRLQQADYFVFDTETTSINWREATLVGLSFSLQAGEAYYIPLAHALVDDALVSQQLPKDEVLASLKPILQNPKIGKIGQHLKYDAHVLSQVGIEVNNWLCDTMLASYVLNAAATRHGMDDLARYYLQKQTITFEDVAGKGAKQVTFDQVAISTASDYACEDADITLQLFELFNKKLAAEPTAKTLLEQLEIPTAQVLTQMEANGILLNRDFLTQLSAQFDTDIAGLQQTAYSQAGVTFNLSSPKQLGEILFDKLGIKGGKKTKTGQYSTSEAVLSKIDHPLVESVLAYRSLTKLKSTYTDALNQQADAQTSRVHTSYHQALTSTGRLSSTDPNLQNIPIRTATGRLIRQAFIAPQGRVLLAADYSQIELRLMAHFSADPALTHAFNAGLDIHSATAAEVMGKTVAEVTSSERRRAKAINFGLLYGMSAFGLAKQLELSREEAQNYIDQYFKRYPMVLDYMHRTRSQAYKQGYVETLLGRKLYTPDVSSSNRMVKQAAERAAINAPLQGSAADIIKLAMLDVAKVLPKDNARMLLQVHDELVFECDEVMADQLAQQIQTTMESVLQNHQNTFKVNFSVPLVVEVGRGMNWDEAH